MTESWIRNTLKKYIRDENGEEVVILSDEEDGVKMAVTVKSLASVFSDIPDEECTYKNLIAKDNNRGYTFFWNKCHSEGIL